MAETQDKRKLGVLFIGVAGAIATTVIAGVLAIRKGIAPIRGMLTETDLFQSAKLVALEDLSFAGWDLRDIDLVTAAKANGIVSNEIIRCIEPELVNIGNFRGFSANVDDFTKEVFGVKEAFVSVQDLEQDIASFREDHELTHIIVINVSSTEVPISPELQDYSLEEFETAVLTNSHLISPSMIYAYAALNSGCSFINFTPSYCVELPALQELAQRRGVAIAGKDGKTGQTLYKTALAPMFKARDLKVNGWYSTNILGNNDGAILSDSNHATTKIYSKSGVLQDILGYEVHHQVRIDYYPPRGDNKEAWDNVDFEGWLGQKMCMKINWQASDSALAAPLIVDLARLVELAVFQGEAGVLDYLGMFFKSPYGSKDRLSNDFFKQRDMLIKHFAK